MEIHIGKVIKEFAENVKIENMDVFCMEKLNMTKQNYYRVLKKASMNTDMLLAFCAAFNHDFFQHYYDVEPLKSIGIIESKKLEKENRELILTVDRKEDLLRDYERKIAILKEENLIRKEKKSTIKSSSRQKRK